jgi:hypothetical protein
MMKKHLLIFVHGMGSGYPQEGYEQLWEAVSQAYCRLKNIDRNNFSQFFEPLYVNWGNVTYEAKKTVFKSAFPHLEIKDFSAWDLTDIRNFRALRHFVSFFLGDVTAYVSCNDNNIRRTIWQQIQPFIIDRHYSLIAYSLGSVIAFDYLFNLFIEQTIFLPEYTENHQKLSSKIEEDISKYQDNFRHLFTCGSPIGLFMLRKGEIWKDGKNFSDIINPVKSEPEKEINRNWLNFYDRQDILAYPLKNLFDRNPNNYEAAIEDILIDTGDFIIDSHTQYWHDRKMAQEIAKVLSQIDFTPKQLSEPI